MSLWNNSEPTTDRKSPVPMAPPPERQEPVAAKPPEAAAVAPTPPAPGSDLLLGRGARFEGKLTFEGTVRIDARFIGSIVTNDVLVVGEAARIDADITCGTIVIHGEVNGNIKAKTAVEIHHTAKVRGDLETPSLAIQKGAAFNGASKMDGGTSAKAESNGASKMDGGTSAKAESNGASKAEGHGKSAAAKAAAAAPAAAPAK
jgi:cytoskeletal protein CcmA (bactofilin family)